MPEAAYRDIRKLHLFEAMAEEHFATLMRGAFVQNFPPQVELITEGDASDFLHVVLSGSVDLFATWHDRETSMATVRPVSTFILAATIRDAPYLMSARTLEKSRIALIPSETVRAIFDIDGGFARAMVAELAQAYRSVIRAQKDLKLRTSTERLANYLLRAQEHADQGPEFDLDLEKRRLASVLGMTPEHLSRSFRGLQSHGVVAQGNRIRIDDRAKLERYARSTPLIDDPST
ncbi:helix-turn-helix domain-containing protein [Citreimonas salinaria]|uniref:CRP/FNR family transcriptional regulator, transcriptional activator FtrB n=1 Tax=Citreimonas salinaria TaxID=321339 RepID=A0A1H3GSH2_9RHOB|nr:helix-turn-helix domain-containing protein [Citreimonas salinaria]SDY05915.1 CRP/FNR family transcriptional regulator, transcriptional activator FtrB [Citreimonas salinaria]